MKYTEWNIKAERPEDIENITAVLVSEGIYDSVINDPRDIKELLNKENPYDWDYVDDSVLKMEERMPSVTVYTDENGEERRNFEMTVIPLLEKTIKGCSIESRSVCDEDWKDEWKKYFKPAKITDRIVVRPTWETYKKSGDQIVIEIDPGMAFGTGTHETTSLCVELIEKYIRPGDRLLDVGCGSGILSIAAGLLGAGDVLAIDIDPVAVGIAEENTAKNGLSDKVSVRCGDLTEGVEYKADIVAANLMADLVKELSPMVPAHIKKNGIYISSGILEVLADSVKSRIEESGFEIIETLVKGEWCAIAARCIKEV